MGFHKDAYQCFMAVLSHQPAHAGALTAIGHLFQKESMLNEAVEARRLRPRRSRTPPRLLRLRPVEPLVGRRTARAQQQQRGARVRRAPPGLAFSQPRGEGPLPSLIAARRSFGPTPQAHTRALEAEPGRPETVAALASTLTDLGTRHKNLGRTFEARRMYELALNVMPSCAVRPTPRHPPLRSLRPQQGAAASRCRPAARRGSASSCPSAVGGRVRGQSPSHP